MRNSIRLLRHINTVVLFLILLAGAITFIAVRNDSETQLVVGILTVGMYIFWGILNHILEKDIHYRIVVEYVLTGIIAILLLVMALT